MQLSGFAAGPYQTNTYLLYNDTHAVVVDPGMHAHDRVVDFLEGRSLALEAVVLTHGHLDHTRDAGDLAHRFNVPVWIHPDDEFMLDAGTGLSTQTRALFDADNMVAVDDLRHFADGETYTFLGHSFHLRHAPGHSPGSVLLVAEEFALVGDVVFRGSIGRTDLPFADPEVMDATLKGPVAQLDDGLQLLPGHGPTTTMRTERAHNPYLRGLGR